MNRHMPILFFHIHVGWVGKKNELVVSKIISRNVQGQPYDIKLSLKLSNHAIDLKVWLNMTLVTIIIYFNMIINPIANIAILF
jgi:hypothetical protein